MAHIALPHRDDRGARLLPALSAAALFLSAAALAGLLSVMQVPSTAAYGLPADWGQRAAWLAVEALVGLGAACVLLAIAGRRSEN
jgi:hypothetical protein